jgi:hypothetical protein
MKYQYCKVTIVNLKHIALQLCTCTWIEIMTAVGITLYLTHLQSYNLAALTVAAFMPLIGFHFAVDKLSNDKADWGQNRLIKIRSSKRKLVD